MNLSQPDLTFVLFHFFLDWLNLYSKAAVEFNFIAHSISTHKIWLIFLNSQVDFAAAHDYLLPQYNI